MFSNAAAGGTSTNRKRDLHTGDGRAFWVSILPVLDQEFVQKYWERTDKISLRCSVGCHRIFVESCVRSCPVLL